MKSVKHLGIFICALGLSSCGKNAIFEKVQVTTLQIQNDVWISADAQVNTGQLQFAAATLPIVNPQNPSEVLGRVSLLRDAQLKNVLRVEADLTLLSQNHLQGGAMLPNGAPLPITGINMAGIPISSHSQFYIGALNDTIVLGTAVAIKPFDEIGMYVPGVNLFWDIPASTQVSAIGGAFTGAQTGQSGLALFLKITASQGQSLTVSKLSLMNHSTDQVVLLSNDKTVSSKIQMNLAQRMLNLEQKRLRLRMH